MEPETTTSAGKVLHIEQGALRGVTTLEIGTDRGTFSIGCVGKASVRIGDTVIVMWRAGLPRLVEHTAGYELWRERFCDLCGNSDVEHNTAECHSRREAAEQARIAAYGECPTHDLGIDFAGCICPPLQLPTQG